MQFKTLHPTLLFPQTPHQLFISFYILIFLRNYTPTNSGPGSSNPKKSGMNKQITDELI